MTRFFYNYGASSESALQGRRIAPHAAAPSDVFDLVLDGAVENSPATQV